MSYYDDMKQALRREPTYEELKQKVKFLEDQSNQLEGEAWEQADDQIKEILGAFGWREETKPKPVPVKTCSHLREDSRYCGSIAVKDRDFCPHHLRERARGLRMAQARARRQRVLLQLPPLEDLYAVQVSIGQVLNALLSGQLDKGLGGTVLYGLQQAATNLCRPVEVWEESRPFQCNEQVTLPGLEEEFGLPQGIDLNASPEKAFPETETAAVGEEKAAADAGAPPFDAASAPLLSAAVGDMVREELTAAPPLSAAGAPPASVADRVGEQSADRKEPQSEVPEAGGQEKKLG
jgi:hypothetical protein